MATQDATDGQIKSFDGTMLLQGLYGVLTTRRGEAAGRGCQGGDETAVETNGSDEQSGNGLA